MPKRHYTAADIGHVRLTGEAMVEICEQDPRRARRLAQSAWGRQQGCSTYVGARYYMPGSMDCRPSAWLGGA